jgi:hypothetical protein
MKTGYAIILAVFCFGLMSSTVDELAIFNQNIHDVGVSVDDIAAIENTTATMTEVNTVEEDSILSDMLMAGKGLGIGIKVLLSALGKTVVIYGTLVGYGVYTEVAAMIQGMVTLVESVLIVEFILNRRASQ